jgi:hypothetical protein
VTSAAPDGPDPKPLDGPDAKLPDPAVAKLLRWYPRAWRERYGDEFLAMVEDSLDGRPPTMRLHLSVAWAGLRERDHQVRQAAARRLTAGAPGPSTGSGRDSSSPSSRTYSGHRRLRRERDR